jgi:hypothetical protein
MKWTEILTWQERERIGIEHGQSVGVSGGWGGSYGATKSSFQDAVEKGVYGVLESGIPLKRLKVRDGSEDGFAGVLLYDSYPSEKKLVEWSESRLPWSGAIARAVEITNLDVDLTPPKRGNLIDHIGKKLAKINKLPRFPRSRNPKGMREAVIRQIGELYWQEVFRRVQFDGEFLGMTFEHGLAHSQTEKNHVGWVCINVHDDRPDPEEAYGSSYRRRYFVYGKEFLVVFKRAYHFDSERKWLCQSSTATKWSSILKHAKLQLVEEVQAA